MLLPLELWTEISKRLPVQDLKNLRLSSRLLYVAPTSLLYDKCHITLFLESARNGCIETLIKIYNHNDNVYNDLIQHPIVDILSSSLSASFILHHVVNLVDYSSFPKTPSYKPFELASMNGHLNIIKQLYDWVQLDKEKVAMITADGYRAFVLASMNGHLNIIKQLYDWVQLKVAMITFDGYRAFVLASETGQLNIIKQLYDWVPSDEQKMAMITNILSI